VALNLLVGSARVCVDQLEGLYPTRAVLDLGVQLPLPVGAAGKAILAFLDRETRDSLLGTLDLVSYTDKTIVDPKKLQTELTRISRVGFSQSDGERVPGMSGVAAPIFDSNGSAVASLAVVGIATRFTAEVRAVTGPLVRVASQHISESLGFTRAARLAHGASGNVATPERRPSNAV
jgi:DNA-binding IclR family transcriptional regulator